MLSVCGLNLKQFWTKVSDGFGEQKDIQVIARNKKPITIISCLNL
jgi:hypothetical protein